MFPTIRLLGLAATIVAGAALATPPAVAAAGAAAIGDGLERSFDCAGGVANVSGANNRIVLTGRCHILNVSGDGNRVEVELQAGQPINVMGSANQIVYRLVDGRTPPVVNLIGADNKVEADRTVANDAAAIDTIEVADDGEDRQLDCAGRGVAVRGDSNRLRLAGGCRTLVVSGDSNVIQAEMSPGSSILVSGDNVAITYSVKGEGPAPSIRVSGSGSAVTPAPPAPR
ncbi:hypothetical protein BN1110_00642 [bacterium YEK0313]|nr:hypothetical protein BN1110_00642 [bacterium YEK0313]